jgi:hypothetical protein
VTSRQHPSTTSLPVKLLLLILVGSSLFAHYRLVPYADDDAYIHMRVARALWQTGAPYFNAGEPVMASTSPLWVVLTAPAALAHAAQPLVIALYNACILVGAAYAWALLYVRLIRSHRLRDLVCAIGVVLFTVMPASIGLMETPLAMLLVGGGLLSIVGGGRWGLPLVCAAVFVRPECALFAIAAVVGKFVRRSSWTAFELAVSAIITGGFVAFQAHFFGSLYPHTARAKEIVYQLTGGEYVRLLSIASYGDWTARNVVPFVIVIAAVLCITATLRSKRLTPSSLAHTMKRNPLLVALLPAAAILATYSIKRVFVFPWYAPLYLVPIHLALLWGSTHAAHRVRPLLVTLLVPLLVMSGETARGIYDSGHLPFFGAGARARKLKHIGEWLALEHPHSKVLAPEIGALGFAFPGELEDAIGLASPKALQFHPLKVPEQRPTGYMGGVPARLVERERPDVIVSLDVFMTDFLKSKIAETYEIRRVPPLLEEDRARLGGARVFGAEHLIIAVRK